MTALLSLLGGGNGLIAGLLAAFVGALALFFKGRSSGVNSERAKQDRQRIESMQKAKEIDNEIENLGSNDVDERFKKWLRKD